MPVGNNASYPASILNRANYYASNYYSPILYNLKYNNCTNTLCYTHNHNYIYKPHTAYGMVGTTAAARIGRRNRL
jgi:hypothetical protein